MKQKVLNYLDIACYAALIIATILVIIFEFVASTAVLKVAIVFYAICLALLVAFTGARIYFSEKAKNELALNVKEPAENSLQAETAAKITENSIDNSNENSSENLEDVQSVNENQNDADKMQEKTEPDTILTKGQNVCAWIKLSISAIALVLVIVICFMF